MIEIAAKYGPGAVWCPFPEGDSAALAAKSQLDEWPIACANIVPGMPSLFVWDGARGEAKEVGMLLETDAALRERVMTWLAGRHPDALMPPADWSGGIAPKGSATWSGTLPR